ALQRRQHRKAAAAGHLTRGRRPSKGSPAALISGAAVDFSIRAAYSIRAPALIQVAVRAKKASLLFGSLAESAEDRHCLALARYSRAMMLVMLITLRPGDAKPKGE